jgi:hypothetical protein
LKFGLVALALIFFSLGVGFAIAILAIAIFLSKGGRPTSLIIILVCLAVAGIAGYVLVTTTPPQMSRSLALAIVMLPSNFVLPKRA